MSGAKETLDNEAKQTENTDSSSTVRVKKSSGLLGTILLVVFFLAVIFWLRFSPAAPSKISSETPDETSEEQQKEDLRNGQINDALDKFLETNYSDWQEQGKSFDDNFSDKTRLQIIDVHLVNGNKNQIIKVFVEKFQKDAGGGEYWFAYQPEKPLIPENQTAKKSPAGNSSDKDETDEQ